MEKRNEKPHSLNKYPKQRVAADIVIFTVMNEKPKNYRKLPEKKLKILLIERGREPYKDHYALPGGFLHSGETLEDAAMRELREETGVACNYLRQLQTISTVDRDPREDWIISCSYIALINSEGLQLSGGTDSKSAAWFEISFQNDTDSNQWTLSLTCHDICLRAILKQKKPVQLDGIPDFEIVQNESLAFDHALIIARAAWELRKQIKESDIAFRLLPEKFTIAEVKQVYDAILDDDLCMQAFRREIKPSVIETEEFSRNAGHRPSKLYIYSDRYNK